MTNGILGPDAGFMIVVNGQNRSFRDREAAAYDAAVFLKQGKCKKDLVQVRHHSDGQTITIEEDGRRTVPA